MEYEPEGFDLGDGFWYLPDFLLRGVLIRNGGVPQDLWVEVKGEMTATDAEKICRFKDISLDDSGLVITIKRPILILWNIPDGDDASELTTCAIDSAYDYDRFPRIQPFNFDTIDGDHYAAFPCINKKGNFAIIGGDYIDAMDFKATEKAYRSARQASFEQTNSHKFGG